MRLTRLRILRTPGIRTPFTLEPAPGINLVTGPNGVGKSTVSRAVLSLLWPNLIREEPFEAEAEFEIGNERTGVFRRDLEMPAWTAGQRPNLGSDHLAPRYLLGVLDLLVSDPRGDLLAREIRNRMAGGFDLGDLRESLFRSQPGRSEKNELNVKGALVTSLKKQQQSLVLEQDRLEELKAERDLAAKARSRLAALEDLREMILQTAAHDDAAARLKELPGACAAIRSDDPAKLKDLRRQEREHQAEIEKRTSSLGAISRELSQLRANGGLDGGLSLGLLKKKHGNLVELRRDLRLAERDSGGLNLDEVLDGAADKPSLLPVILMLTGGSILLAAGLLLPLPKSFPLILDILGAVLLGGGLLAIYNYSRGANRSRLALEKAQEIAAKKDHLARCRGQLDDALVDFNATLALAGLDSVSDADEAAQLLEDLAERGDRMNTLVADQRNQEEFLNRGRADLKRVSGDTHTLLERLGLDNDPGSDAEVSRLLDLLPRFEQAVRDRDLSEREVDRLTRSLAEHATLLGSEETPTMSEGKLADLIDLEKQRAEEYGDLVGKITQIELRVEQAMMGDDLQEALAAESAARTVLTEVRQANREAALGRLVLDRVEQQHEKETRPLVLDRADEYFTLFTGGRYGLKLAARADGEDRFLAEAEDSVVPLELGELSDGTRAQLLLAVKLAFITAGEEGARPPIFLDDSLTSADPERFAAVAASLGHLAEEEGRQIFYLTPNPGDAAAFRRALSEAGLTAPHHIDLAVKRDVAGAADPELLDPANLPTRLMAPDPHGMSAREYAAALMVPLPDPWAPPGAIHVFHVLPDDLALVRRLVDGNASTLTRFERSGKTLVTAAIITAQEAERVAAGGELWSAWLDGWRLGRARPVTPEFLKESAAVSEKFLAPVTAALEDCGWNGADLLEAIENKKVKRFQTAKLEQLRQELDEADLIAAGNPLTDDQLISHTMDRVAPLLAAGLLDMTKVRTLALTFKRLVASPEAE